ncbi:MAG: ABC transporter permease [Devosia sp.]
MRARAWGMKDAGGVLGALLIGGVALVALFAPFLSPGDPLDMVARPLLAPFADAAHPFGTDRLGRDVLAGLIHGARTSLIVGAVAAAASLGFGALAGLVAGFAGGVVDAVVMRIAEAFQTMPTFLFALALVGGLGASMTTVIIAIALASWPAAARLVRAEVLRIRTQDYVAAAQLTGRAPVSIAFLDVFPNALQPVMALIGIAIGEAILVESALAFLGLSDPNVLSWGGMVAEGRAVVRSQPSLVVIPGIAVALTVLAFSLAGDLLSRPRGR